MSGYDSAAMRTLLLAADNSKAIGCPNNDYLMLTMRDMGMIKLHISPTKPTTDQEYTVWMAPGAPAFVTPGVIKLYDTAVGDYVTPTRDLWAKVLTRTEHEIYSGNGAPAAAIGADESWYVKTDVPRALWYKTAGTWHDYSSSVAIITSTTYPPANSEGEDGDYGVTPHGIYGPKAGGAWPAQPVDSAGGSDVVIRKYTGSQPIPGTFGEDGDYAVSPDGLFGPKAAGAWPVVAGEAEVPDSSITHPKLAADAVETGNIKDDQVTEAKLDPAVRTKLNLPVKATAAEVTTGTDDAKYVTPLGLIDALDTDNYKDATVTEVKLADQVKNKDIFVDPTTATGGVPDNAYGTNGSYILYDGKIWGPKASNAWPGTALANSDDILPSGGGGGHFCTNVISGNGDLTDANFPVGTVVFGAGPGQRIGTVCQCLVDFTSGLDYSENTITVRPSDGFSYNNQLPGTWKVTSAGPGQAADGTINKIAIRVA